MDAGSPIAVLIPPPLEAMNVFRERQFFLGYNHIAFVVIIGERIHADDSHIETKREREGAKTRILIYNVEHALIRPNDE